MSDESSRPDAITFPVKDRLASPLAMSYPLRMEQALKDKIADTISNCGDFAAVVVYGSTAKNSLRADSDIDVALLRHAGDSIAIDTLVQVNLALESACGRKVDLVDLSQARGTLLSEILKHGIFLKNDDREAYARVLKRHVYDQADFMPSYRLMLQRRRERFLNA